MKTSTLLKLALSLVVAYGVAAPIAAVQAEPYAASISVHSRGVRCAGEEVFDMAMPAGGFTARDRATIVERNIDNALMASADRSPNAVTVDYINFLPVIRLGGYHIVTIDSNLAAFAGTSREALAESWATNLRNALADSTRISAYINNLSGNVVAIASPDHRAQYEAARENHAAPQFLESLPAGAQTAASLTADGFKFMKEGRYLTASVSFEEALGMGSNNSQAHLGLGKALLKLGQIPRAMGELQCARWLEPNNALTHIALGQGYQAQGKDVDALKQYREAELLQPDNPEPYLMISEIRESRNDIGLSVAELTDARARMPRSEFIRLKRHDQMAYRLEQPM